MNRLSTKTSKDAGLAPNARARSLKPGVLQRFRDRFRRTESGHVHSIHSFSTVDGPGVRGVVFLQGCAFRCLYCQNPDTWAFTGGQRTTASDVMRELLRYNVYYQHGGGITFSGGEPLMQPGFLRHLTRACWEYGIHTAVDTSGCCLNSEVRWALETTNLVLLDIKHTDPARHLALTGHSQENTLSFLDYITKRNIPTWIRQVIVPGWNDQPKDMMDLAAMLRSRPNIERVELLPLHHMGSEKWRQLGLEYRLADTMPPSPDTMNELRNTLRQCGLNVPDTG